jgi:hypothetical protein
MSRQYLPQQALVNTLAADGAIASSQKPCAHTTAIENVLAHLQERFQFEW